jgi:hypothetical protein
MMTNGQNNFDDLHAPEVVKPLSQQQEMRRRDREAQEVPAAKPQPEPPVESKAHPDKIASTPAAKPAQPKTPASPPLADSPSLPRAESKPEPPSLPQNQPTKPSSHHWGWLAPPIIAGIVLLIWYAAVSTQSNPEPVRAEHTQPPDVPYSGVAVSRGGSEPAVFALPVATTASPKPTGKLRLSAFAVVADDQHHPITRKATMELRHIGSDFSISTNIGVPCLWSNIPTGEHRLSLAIPGFRHSTTSTLTVVADATKEIAVAMQPLPARVRFAFPATNVVFGVYNDTRLLGDSTTAFDLTPFVPHSLTFKADGWRAKRVKVQLPEPGTAYRCPIGMERVEAGLRITVNTRKGEPPAFGFLSIDGGKPVEIELPLERQALPVTGALTLVLAVDGFTVLDSTQRVVLVDREMADAVFTVEKRSWMSRLLGPSTRHTGKE